MKKQNVVLTSDIEKDYKEMVLSIPPFTFEEEKKQFFTYQQTKDLSIRDEIVRRNLYLVVSAVDSYFRYGNNVEYMDLIQDGNIALVKAIEKFDLNYQKPFYQYGSSCIRSAIKDALTCANHPFCSTLNPALKLYRYRTLKNRYEAKKEVLPNNRVLADLQDVSVETIECLQKIDSMELISFHDYNLEESRMKDVSGFEDFFEDIRRNYDSIEFMKFCKVLLQPHHYFVLYHAYFSDHPMSFEQIGTFFFSVKQNANALAKSAFQVLRPYLIVPSFYTLTLKRHKQKYGQFYQHLSVEPIYPREIVQFLYAEPYLSELEKRILKFRLLDYIDIISAPCNQILGISKNEYFRCLENLKRKMAFIFADTLKYQTLQDLCISSLKSQIYRVPLDQGFQFLEGKNLQRDLKI